MPPKSKGRGKGAGRGRGKGRGQHQHDQEKRPGRAAESSTQPTSADSGSRPSLSQKSKQTEVAETLQRVEQKPEIAKVAPREEVLSDQTSATKSPSRPEPASARSAHSQVVGQKQHTKRSGGAEKKDRQSLDQVQGVASNLNGPQGVTVQTPDGDKRPGQPL